MKNIFISLLVLLVIIGVTARTIALENLNIFSKANNLIAGTCNQYDTDNNGYVSCTARDNGKLIQLECGSSWLAQSSGSYKIPTIEIHNYYNN